MSIALLSSLLSHVTNPNGSLRAKRETMPLVLQHGRHDKSTSAAENLSVLLTSAPSTALVMNIAHLPRGSLSALKVHEISDSSTTSPSPSSSTQPTVRTVSRSEWTPTLISLALGDSENGDVASVLSKAVDRVRELRKQYTAGLYAIATEGISIPPEVAKTWIQNYFLNMPTELFSSLIDRKLIEMIPDLLPMQDVKLEPSVVLIYFAILYHGCFLTDRRSYGGPHAKYARQLYLCCLRIIPFWQKRATGTLSDFIAAIFMTKRAVECFDFEMSWEMHKLACEYAHGLQMHNLDATEKSQAIHGPVGDNDRKGMWELIQTDLFYSLVYDKTPALFSRLSDWRVNLPSLESPPDTSASAPVPTMAFLVNSRITFILMEFFRLLSVQDNHSPPWEAVESLGLEIENVLEEWKIEDWIQSFKHDGVYTWALADLAFLGHTCIIFMLRKAAAGSDSFKTMLPGAKAFQSKLALRASRRILYLIHHALEVMNLPGPQVLACVFSAYRAHVAYAYFANHIMTSFKTTDPEDVSLLERVACSVETIAEKEQDFRPLAQGMRSVNGVVQSYVKRDEDKGLEVVT
ncbi:hypothetical protein NCS52_00968600 [Fusarium sp. LHS14.1]|nr:hypothetical protein NCS52_00968600 [Fusarium sp. LHS14.1]